MEEGYFLIPDTSEILNLSLEKIYPSGLAYVQMIDQCCQSKNGAPLLKRRKATRVMVDTNVIISAILKEGSLPDLVLHKVCENHELVLCDYIVIESYDVAKRQLNTINRFIYRFI